MRASSTPRATKPGTLDQKDLRAVLKMVRSLDSDRRGELERIIGADPQVSLWAPSSGPQAQAYVSLADELFYGGAAGGGKSALIAGLALTKHRRSLIIRRESTQMRGMIDDIARTLGTRDGLSTQAGQWRVPAALARFPEQLIEFGGVPDPGSEEKHQGIAHDLLAFDEVTQINEHVVDYLTTWCRSTHSKQRCRVILTSNPPMPSTRVTSRGQATGGGLWLISRYAPWLDPHYRDPFGFGPAKPGELRWYVTLDGVSQEWPDPLPFYHTKRDGGKELVKPRSRTFIPARVSDNPYLADTDYIATLQKLPEPLRSAMLYGSFSVSLSDRPRQLIPTEWLRAAQARYEETANLPRGPMTALGVDVSRGGGDGTVLAPRYGSRYEKPEVVPDVHTLDGAKVAAKVVECRRDDATVVVDAAGVGASAYDHLRKNTTMGNDARVVAYVGSAKSTRRDRSGKFTFPNKRSESYWLFREALDPVTPQRLAIAPDDDLQQELLVLTYHEEGGKLVVMRKEDVVKAIGRSSDRADAVVMSSTVRDEESPQAVAAERHRSNRLAEVRSAVGGVPPRHADGSGASWNDKVLPYNRDG